MATFKQKLEAIHRAPKPMEAIHHEVMRPRRMIFFMIVWPWRWKVAQKHRTNLYHMQRRKDWRPEPHLPEDMQQPYGALRNRCRWPRLFASGVAWHLYTWNQPLPGRQLPHHQAELVPAILINTHIAIIKVRSHIPPGPHLSDKPAEIVESRWWHHCLPLRHPAKKLLSVWVGHFVELGVQTG